MANESMRNFDVLMTRISKFVNMCGAPDVDEKELKELKKKAEAALKTLYLVLGRTKPGKPEPPPELKVETSLLRATGQAGEPTNQQCEGSLPWS